MQKRLIPSEYIDHAMALAEYDKLKDDSFAGQIPPCVGVIAFGKTLRECEQELRSSLEEWLLLGLKLKHSLPEVGGINLNGDPQQEPLQSLSSKFFALRVRVSGFAKSLSGSKHRFLVIGESRLTIPVGHSYSVPQFRRIIEAFRR